jgi:hypothetical protein
MSIQYITDGYNGRDERVVLWRTGEYTYEIEVGSGTGKRSIKLNNTEYYDALEQFGVLVENYQELA